MWSKKKTSFVSSHHITIHNTQNIYNQEIYRPGTAISHASNPCIAMVGDQNKEFRGNASFLRETSPRGGIRIYCYCIFHVEQKAKNHMFSL